jgi:O-antigen ligase
VAFDAINVPKLFVLVVFACIALGVILSNVNHFKLDLRRPIAILASILSLDLVIVFFISSSNYYESLFGTFGRSTGLLAYLSLTVLMIAGVLCGSNVTLDYFIKCLFMAGFLSVVYGLLQIFNLEFFSWTNPYGPVIGFLGNPNFQSSFLGLVGILSFAYSLNFKGSPRTQISYLVFVLLILFVIIKTESQQGIIVLISGVGLISLYRLNFSKFRKSIPALLMFALIALVGSIFGMLNKGPLASILYGPSLTYRGDYWRAGWNMTVDQPILGIGLDNYGEWYRRARTLEATLRRGPETTSNAAHNVLLDLSSNGGFPLLLIYLAVMGVALFSAVKVFKRLGNSTYDPAFVSLFAVWIAYHAQSLISINQIGLAVWGWVITGLIIGYEIHTRKDLDVEPPKNRSLKKNSLSSGKLQKSAGTTIGAFLGLLVGLLISTPILNSSVAYRGVLVSGSLESIVEKSYSWPPNQAHLLQTTQVFRDNKFEAQALEMAEYTVKKYPDSYKAWEILYSIGVATPEDKSEALRQMKRLDPLNPNLK